MTETVLVTGSQGFIGSYLVSHLLRHGYKVRGIDNYEKYGRLVRAHDSHPNFDLAEYDLTKSIPPSWWYEDVNYIIAGAAKIGGIGYFHRLAYDLVAANDRITGNTFDLAINLRKNHELKKIVVISSSMVFENVMHFPTKEEYLQVCPPPSSTYGFNKLNCETYAKGAWEQHSLPYVIVRPFNCVGIGEDESLDDSKLTHGNVSITSSHVLPDLIKKALALQPDDPLPLLGSGDQIRHYTNGKDVAAGIVLAMESDYKNEDFNISSSQRTSVKQLATVVWNQIHGCDPTFTYEEPFEYDVQIRSPDVQKAAEMLGFEAEISLEESVAEVIEYMRK